MTIADDAISKKMQLFVDDIVYLRFVACLSIEDTVVADRRDFRETHVPETLVNKERNPLLYTKVFIRNVDVDWEQLIVCSPTHEKQDWDVHSCTAEIWVVDRIAATVEVEVSWKLKRDVALCAGDVRRLWIAPSEDFKKDFLKLVVKDTFLKEANASWEYPLVLIHSDKGTDSKLRTTELMNFVAAAAEIPVERIISVPERTPYMETDEMTGASSWDGGVFVICKNAVRNLEATWFLMRLIGLDWFSHERAINNARKILHVMDMEPSKRTMSVRNASEDLFRRLSFLEPLQFSFRENDIAFVETIWKSWRREELHKRAIGISDQILQLYRFDIDSQNAKADEFQARSAEYLNQVAIWISVVGVAGTAADIFSAVDTVTPPFAGPGARLKILVLCIFLALIAVLSGRRRMIFK